MADGSFKLVNSATIESKKATDKEYVKTSKRDIISEEQPSVYYSSLEDKSTLLKKLLLELRDPRTTPELALQSLSSPCFCPTTYISEEDNEPFVIFLACMEFIMERLPEGCVEGIWEQVLRKTVNFFKVDLNDFQGVIYALFGLTKVNQVELWLYKAFGTESMCPNPYIRLELFRLVRLFKAKKMDYTKAWENIFINTIREIQPHRFYPSGNEDDVLFSVEDMIYIINNVLHFDIKLQEKKKKEVIFNSAETNFFVNLIQVIGVFANMSRSIPESSKQISHLLDCFTLLMPWMQFRQFVVQPSVHRYVIEVIRDLTAAITSFPKRGNLKLHVELEMLLLKIRDSISMDVCNKTSNLPSLLLYRQINGPSIVHRHSLLLKEISLGRPNSNFKYDGKGGSKYEWSLYIKYCKLRHMCNVFGYMV